jgi:hypothetical protein
LLRVLVNPVEPQTTLTWREGVREFPGWADPSPEPAALFGGPPASEALLRRNRIELDSSQSTLCSGWRMRI